MTRLLGPSSLLQCIHFQLDDDCYTADRSMDPSDHSLSLCPMASHPVERASYYCTLWFGSLYSFALDFIIILNNNLPAQPQTWAIIRWAMVVMWWSSRRRRTRWDEECIVISKKWTDRRLFVDLWDDLPDQENTIIISVLCGSVCPLWAQILLQWCGRCHSFLGVTV